jgi:hypothetical protein
VNRDYAYFYVEGFNEKVMKHDVDTEKLADSVLDGKGTVHEVCVEAARSAARPLEVGRRKKDWIEDYADAIKEAGGDSDQAYQHYLDGRIDCLAADLADDVVQDIEDEVADGDDEDDDDEDDKEDDDGDDEGK